MKLTVRIGRHFYHYRADYLPIGMRCNTGSVYDMVLPRGQPSGTIGVHAVCAFDGNVLPLGCRDDVHVRYSDPILRLYVSLTLWTGTRLLSSSAVVAKSCVLGRCGSLRTLKTRTCTPSEIYSSDPPLLTFTNSCKARLCTHLWWFVG
jgi:hypothetical protein